MRLFREKAGAGEAAPGRAEEEEAEEEGELFTPLRWLPDEPLVVI